MPFEANTLDQLHQGRCLTPGAAGHDLGALLAELHSHTATGRTDARRAALAVLVEACHVAAAVAEAVGHQDLALACAVRENQAARALGDDPAAAGLAGYGLAQTWIRVGARRQAERTLAEAADAVAKADPTAEDTGPAEMAGMVHLASALLGSSRG